MLNRIIRFSLRHRTLVPATAGNVEVFTTHMLAPNQGAACSGLDGTSPSAAQLDAACGTESYFTPF